MGKTMKLLLAVFLMFVFAIAMNAAETEKEILERSFIETATAVEEQAKEKSMEQAKEMDDDDEDDEDDDDEDDEDDDDEDDEEEDDEDDEDDDDEEEDDEIITRRIFNVRIRYCNECC